MTDAATVSRAQAGRRAVVEAIAHRVRHTRLLIELGYVLEVRPPVVVVAMSDIRIGDICTIAPRTGDKIRAEVIGLDRDRATLSPIGPTDGIGTGDMVTADAHGIRFPFSPNLCGSVLDGLGNILSGGEDMSDAALVPVHRAGPMPLDRPLIDTAFLTGTVAIDAFTTLGRGQRMAILGAPGTGKSSLLASIAANCDADVVVIGLVGERSREVQEFLTRHLPEDKRRNVVTVVSTSERPPMERIYAAAIAASIAEEYRDLGKSVLLLVDSVTRVARAVREVGLAAGEAPTRRGYPASVYTALPKLIERAGRSSTGDITALYTVLVEGEVSNDPIAEEVRSLTDGHIELSNELAASGHFPAIDVSHSISRVMSHLVSKPHQEAVTEARKLMSKYEEVRLLVQLGEYKDGNDDIADKAIRCMPRLQEFLTQHPSEPSAKTLEQVAGDLGKRVQ